MQKAYFWEVQIEICWLYTLMKLVLLVEEILIKGLLWNKGE